MSLGGGRSTPEDRISPPKSSPPSSLCTIYMLHVNNPTFRSMMTQRRDEDPGVRAMSLAQFRLRLRVNASCASSPCAKMGTGGGGEGGGRGSFSSFPAGPTEVVVFARGGGRFTGGSWIQPALLRKVVEDRVPW